MKKYYISPNVNYNDCEYIKEKICNEDEDLFVEDLSGIGENLGW